MPSTLSELEVELASLRRDLKRQRVFGLALAVAAVVGLSAQRVVSQPTALTELSVRTLKVVGADGRAQVLISADPAINAGGGSVDILDAQGHSRLGLMAARDGGVVALYRDDNSPSAILGADHNGGMLTLNSNHGTGHLAVAPLNGGMGLSMVSNDNRNVVKLGAGASSSGLQFKGAHGQNALMVASNANGGVLAIFDKHGAMKRHFSALPGW